jgi:hypothetical protein
VPLFGYLPSASVWYRTKETNGSPLLFVRQALPVAAGPDSRFQPGRPPPSARRRESLRNHDDSQCSASCRTDGLVTVTVAVKLAEGPSA